ncbi:MAG: MBL fold metallo-hydrolase [Flavobacteriales bacterium]|nr:MBL fold metallo-hydrolase [Flavobacteriales bacterium]
MQLHTIETGLFKLDGGGMFGVVPKSIWQRTNPADENNMCTWAMRCLLLEEGDRLVLFDCGIGAKQDEKFLKHYYLHGDDTLDKSLAAKGFHRDDITDVFLTHLHFDHCGGAIERDSNGNFRPAFKNATFWSNERHWQWATEPNPRERASFLKENILPIQESGQLKFIKRGEGDFLTDALYGMDILFVDGHTDSQMIPHIRYKGKIVVYMADLLPSTGHIPLPFVMGYDTRPLITLDEKKKFLDRAAEQELILFLEHDSVNECCTVKQGARRVELDEAFPSFESL